ncbi:MAG: heme-binding protein [Candidatus Sphingomonas colombiensis]|nr:heme-binding protein [Sphingomonas sp.]WEK42239.1 MAG: heme-binding protein [Sphingomonas sp.]
MAFAIVEPSGELVAFARMDDAPYASIRLAQQKARTAARLRVATATLEERVRAGRSVLLSADEVIAIGGGVPIVANGRVIGAIGVSGGSADQDAGIAEAAIRD